MASKYQPWEQFHQHVTLWEFIIFLDASMILPFNCPFALGISQLITRLFFKRNSGPWYTVPGKAVGGFKIQKNDALQIASDHPCLE